MRLDFVPTLNTPKMKEQKRHKNTEVDASYLDFISCILNYLSKANTDHTK